MTLITDSPRTPAFGPIGRDVFNRTYSRPLPDGSNETWYDTVRRVVEGNTALDRYRPIGEDHQLRSFMDDFRLLPAGRHLWVTGVPGIPGEARRNCWRAPFTHRLADHFEFVGSMLLLGGGVGANYSAEYLAVTDPVSTGFSVRITCDHRHPDYIAVREAAGAFWTDTMTDAVPVADSREGWADAWGQVFDIAVTGEKLRLDLTPVRPAGAEIKTFGGTASGPGPLASAIAGILWVLHGAQGRRITGLEAMLCDHALASAVVAGGARRSARMSIMHWADPDIYEFLSCKHDHMHHWTTNISVEVDDVFFATLDQPGILGDHARDVLRKVAEGIYRNGEPGLYNSSLASVGEPGDVRATNPCGEVPLEQGESCNIGSVNLDAIGTNDELAEEGFRALTRFLIRQTLTDMKSDLSSSVEERNRRIGAGFLGLQGWAAAHGVRYSDIPKSMLLFTKLRRFAEICRDEADDYSALLGIPSPVKVTAVAPNGSIALLPGTQPGASCIIARWAIRNVRYTTGDVRLDEARAAGLVVEPCVYAENTWVVSYPLADGLVERFDPSLIQQADEVSVDDQLAVLQFVTEAFCHGTIGNAVSYTASFDPKDTTVDALYDIIAARAPFLKGLTAFPTASRPQAPYVPITEAEYLRLTDRGAHDSGDTGSEEIACSIGGGCPIR